MNMTMTAETVFYIEMMYFIFSEYICIHTYIFIYSACMLGKYIKNI